VKTLDYNTAVSIWRYDPDVGNFYWLISPRYKVNIGDRAGYNSQGYWNLSYGCNLYRAHRVAWLMMTGEWPEDQIDHKDRNKLNNRWSNLRQATNAENIRNQALRSNNKSGVKGVHINKRGEYVAQLIVNRKHVLCAYFETLEEAREAYVQASITHHKEFSNPHGVR
jgi:HNH endonuclease/AP2 domain